MRLYITPMSTRSFIAVLLLLNYLLVVGSGCMNRPEDQRERLMVRITDDATNYQACRYLRMDGLETFLAEALASRYENVPQTTHHHLISVVNGVDAHYLSIIQWPLLPVVCRAVSQPIGYSLTETVEVNRHIYTPPWLG